MYRNIPIPETSSSKINPKLISKTFCYSNSQSQSDYACSELKIKSGINKLLNIQPEDDRLFECIRSSSSVKTTERDHDIDVRSFFLIVFRKEFLQSIRVIATLIIALRPILSMLDSKRLAIMRSIHISISMSISITRNYTQFLCMMETRQNI